MGPGEEGHGVDDFAEHHRGPFVEEQPEPAAHGVGRVGAPAGVKGHLHVRRELKLGGKNVGEVFHCMSRQRMIHLSFR